MNSIFIKVRDFTEYPDVRYIEQDEFSGEEFYYKVVKPCFEDAINSDSKLVIDLDNTAGYASSFLDEAFGNLVYDFNYDEIIKRIEIITLEEPDWEDVILKDILPQWKIKKDSNKPRKEYD